jgi:uncharacterized membrane protein YjfL (UPF0719 family)
MFESIYKSLVVSGVFSLMGIAILIVVFVVIEKITPENLWKELVEKQNVALAIMGAAFMLSIAIIIASAING